MKIRQQRTIEKNICKKMILLSFCMILMVSMEGCGNKRKENLTITNVSYDPTREFYEKYNKDFIKYYKDKYGKKVEVIQSHGGSGSQARSVVEGSNGDVVTLALEHDISLIEQTGLINKGWQKRFSNDSAPYTSTIVFLVRKGNEKNIKDLSQNKTEKVLSYDDRIKFDMSASIACLSMYCLSRKASLHRKT